MFGPALYFTHLAILTGNGPVGHSLRVKNGRVVAINAPPAKTDRIIDSRGGLLVPGLINAHDHLELNTFPRLKYRELYTHSRQWIEDIEARFDTDPALVGPRQQPLADRLFIGLLKNLLSGVTTVCHHNPLYRPLRRNPPIRVVKEVGFCHSLFRGAGVQASYRRTKPGWPWIIHLAEGTDAAAGAEFDALDRLGAVGQNTVLVHGVGLAQRQMEALVSRGGGLVWCPGSNLFLFGQTARVQTAARAGKLALGSDSRLTGERDLLAELGLARQTGQLPARMLFRAVTTHAAAVLRLRQGGCGRIVPGRAADLVLLPPPAPPDPFEHVCSISRSQIELVMLAGKPLAGSPEMEPVFTATRTRFSPVWVDGVEKLLARNLLARLKRSPVGEPGVTW